LKLRFILLISTIILFLNAADQRNFILNTGNLLDQRAGDEISTMGNEVKAKLNISVYLDIKGNNGIDPDLPLKDRMVQMKQKELDLIATVLKDSDGAKSYVILTMALDQKYTNILYSDDLKSVIDKDSILDEYVIPLLAAQDKNTLNSKVSAASLNGYAQIADVLAKNKGLKLESSIGSEGKIASTIWKVFMYTMVLVGIVLYFFIILREKKIKKEFKAKQKLNNKEDLSE